MNQNQGTIQIFNDMKTLVLVKGHYGFSSEVETLSTVASLIGKTLQ